MDYETREPPAGILKIKISTKRFTDGMTYIFEF
jgi:hypothetical protein